MAPDCWHLREHFLKRKKHDNRRYSKYLLCLLRNSVFYWAFVPTSSSTDRGYVCQYNIHYTAHTVRDLGKYRRLYQNWNRSIKINWRNWSLYYSKQRWVGDVTNLIFTKVRIFRTYEYSGTMSHDKFTFESTSCTSVLTWAYLSNSLYNWRLSTRRLMCENRFITSISMLTLWC